MPNPMVRSLYKSAVMEDYLHVTWEPMHGIRHMRGHFGVVFHAQSNGHYILQRGIDSEQFSAVHATSKSGLQFSSKLYKQIDFITLRCHNQSIAMFPDI